MKQFARFLSLLLCLALCAAPYAGWAEGLEEAAAATAEAAVAEESTIAPTATPTVAPTAEPTTEPTVESTIEATIEPTVELTIEPISEPTVASTVEPTASPTETPAPDVPGFNFTRSADDDANSAFKGGYAMLFSDRVDVYPEGGGEIVGTLAGKGAVVFCEGRETTRAFDRLKIIFNTSDGLLSGWADGAQLRPMDTAPGGEVDEYIALCVARLDAKLHNDRADCPLLPVGWILAPEPAAKMDAYTPQIAAHAPFEPGYAQLNAGEVPVYAAATGDSVRASIREKGVVYAIRRETDGNRVEISFNTVPAENGAAVGLAQGWVNESSLRALDSDEAAAHVASCVARPDKRYHAGNYSLPLLPLKCALAQVDAPVTVEINRASAEIGYRDKGLRLLPVFSDGRLTEPDGTPRVKSIKSSNTRIATVSAAGVVYGARKGSTTVRIDTIYGSVSCKITVKSAPRKFTLKSAPAKLMVGEAGKVTPVYPKGYAGTCSYLSSNPKVLAVSADGSFAALSKGSAVVTAKSFNGKKATTTVSVYDLPTKVELPVREATLGVGMGGKLAAKLPAYEYGALSFRSENPGVATIDGDGMVRAVGAGETTLTVSTTTGHSASCKLTVKPAPETIGFSANSLGLGLKESLNLADFITVPDGSHTSYSFSSSNTKYVKMSAKGVLTAARTGSANITVRTHNGKTAKIKVTVYKAPKKLTAKPASLKLGVGMSQKITATFPKGYFSNLSFRTSNAAVAAVDRWGTVTATGAGTATITIQTFNKKTAKCKISVLPAPEKITVQSAEIQMGALLSEQLVVSIPAGTLAVLRYESSDESIVTVDAAGRMTARKAGEAVVSAITQTGVRADVRVRVLPAPTAIGLEKTEMSLCAGEQGRLRPTCTPADAIVAYTYASSNPSVAKVDADGRISALKAGSATITATAQSGAAAQLTLRVTDYAAKYPVLSVAHRGASGYRTENTIAAFEYAAALGADMVELDVRKTSDGKIIVYHDATVLISKKAKAVSGLTYKQIKAVKPHVCTLEEALRYLATTDMGVMIEIKLAGFEADIVKCARASGLGSRVTYSSSSASALSKIKALESSAHTLYYINDPAIIKRLTDNPQGYDFDAVGIYHPRLTAEISGLLHLGGKDVFAWTCNAQADIDTAISKGVDGILSDYPDRVRKK